MTWHLEFLGLPPHADRVAVRRAYAAALRAIDPATDPAGFARLREAYEAAREHCERMDQADAASAPVPEPPPASDPEPEPEAEPTAAAEVPPTVDATVTLAWRFAADVGARRIDAIPQLLADALAELRMQYIDAPGRFEEYLIDLLGMQRIGHRADVFAAAETQFHWHELGHLASLGGRGRWIEAVLAQRDDWRTLIPERQANWLALLTRAEARLDEPLLKRWPEVRRLLDRYPAWMGLHVSQDTLDAWRAAYDALPPATRDLHERIAPPDAVYQPAAVVAAREKHGRGRTDRLIGFLLISLFVGAAHLCSTAHQLRSREVATPTAPPLPMTMDTPRECVELYATFDRADAFAGKSPDEIAQLKLRAHRCARQGHWHAPTR